MAKKEIGQNFLINPDVAERIVNELNLKEGENVLEIGFGAGSLTYFLAQSSAHVTGIDIDEALYIKTRDDFASHPNIEIVNGNAMRWDYSEYDKIIGNLPYYITSGIIERALLSIKKATRCVFMVQKEALDRLLAKTGTKEYGPLAILIALSGNATKCFNVGRANFMPAPHVDSAVFKIDLFEERKGVHEVYEICQKLFLQRRKTLANNLKNYLHNASEAAHILGSLGIASNARPEDIEPKDYLSLCEAIKTSRIKALL